MPKHIYLEDTHEHFKGRYEVPEAREIIIGRIGDDLFEEEITKLGMGRIIIPFKGEKVISKVHTIFHRYDLFGELFENDFTIIPYGRNPTYVNREKISSETSLHDNDRLGLDTRVLVFRVLLD